MRQRLKQLRALLNITDPDFYSFLSEYVHSSLHVVYPFDLLKILLESLLCFYWLVSLPVCRALVSHIIYSLQCSTSRVDYYLLLSTCMHALIIMHSNCFLQRRKKRTTCIFVSVGFSSTSNENSHTKTSTRYGR